MSLTHIMHNSNLLVVVLFLFISSCSKNNSSNVESLEFEINDNLLSDEISIDEMNLSIRPPIDWYEIVGEDFEKASQSIKEADNLFSLKLKHMFVSNNASTLIINEVGGTDFDYLPDDFQSLLRDNFNVESILDSEFFINEIPIKQFIINISDKIIFKLFINNINNDLQIDYIIPRNEYANELRKLESSLGSLTKTKKESK